MAENKPRKRLLFVDDEASIRLTLPPILDKAGFDVHVAESVADALFEINSFQFDALVTDLNIGEEGDGFLVASGMRHIQPACSIFILTGYPAFETALQAIHSQVDDYLVKPVEIDNLVGALKARVEKPATKPEAKRISALLKENSAEIEAAILASIKREAKASSTPLRNWPVTFRFSSRPSSISWISRTKSRKPMLCARRLNTASGEPAAALLRRWSLRTFASWKRPPID